MVVMFILSIVLIFFILILLFLMCFYVRRPVEHNQLYAKLPSMPHGYLADLKLCFRHATLKPKGWYIIIKLGFKTFTIHIFFIVPTTILSCIRNVPTHLKLQNKIIIHTNKINKK